MKNMSTRTSHCLVKLYEERRQLEDYQGGTPRWCNGCGDNAILTVMQRLCRDEGLRPEKTVFVSGIGCSSRIVAYVDTYGINALPTILLLALSPTWHGNRLEKPLKHQTPI